MKTIRIIVAALFVTAVASISTFAQGGATKTPATQPQTQPTQTAPATVNVPPSKTAIIDTGYFGDEKEGITRFVNALKSLDREFQPRRTKLEQMAKRYEVLVEEINKLVNSPVVDQKTIQAKREEAEKLQRDYKYEEEDYKVVAGRRSNEVLGPIRKEIYDALVVFSNQRGITMLFDVGGENPPPIIFAIPSIDITKAFIVEFNAKNPGTAASTTTPGTTPTRP